MMTQSSSQANWLLNITPDEYWNQPGLQLGADKIMDIDYITLTEMNGELFCKF
jgi:hypothetical protein